jgi:HTH-type transcriptional regulator/antitoxin HigA
MKNPNIAIRTEEDYDKLSKFAYDLSFKENKTEEEETVLNLICDLIDQWDEAQGYTMDLPDPIEVILHEMDAQNLTRKDLIPYIGSQSKVSEVLNRKRPLSKNMIIALHEGLGIPYEALMKDSVIPVETLFNSQLTELEPIVKQKEIQVKFGWYVSDFLQFIASLINKLGGEEALPKMGLARKNDENRTNATTDRTRLFAWYLRVLELAHEEIEVGYPEFINIDATFIQQVARCSHFNDVTQAKQLLKQKGIILVHVPHLKKTHLDASVLFYKNHPVIGMTLRYDRADNFWFTLCHELAHVLHDIEALKTNTIFTDDITLDLSNDVTGIEHRADETASNSLIPPEEWYQQIGTSIPSISKIALLASKWKIHPAIIAGRIQRERKDYRILTEFKQDTSVKQFFL